MFTCSDGFDSAAEMEMERRKCSFLSSSSRAPFSQLARSPAARSAYSSSSGRSTVDLSSSVELKEEDEALLALAQAARAKVEAARCVGFPSGSSWKERKDCQAVHVFERRPTTSEYEVAASTTLPCSSGEIMEVLSSRNSDDFNATMVALAGDAFSYAVTLREVPLASADAHLSTKRVQFSGAIPLVSSSKSFEFLDYVEFDYDTRTAVRTIQLLARDRAGRLTVAGDVMAGYVLGEQVASHLTSVFFFGSHATDSSLSSSKGLGKAKSKLKAVTLREASVQGLLKLAKLIPKVGDIALRRRFGAQDVVDPAEDTGASGPAKEGCSGCSKPLKESLLRKKHSCYLCGQFTCSSCSKVQDVEGRIGVIERLRICCACISATRHQVFENSGPIAEAPVLLLRASTLSVLSTSSSAATFRSTARASRSRAPPSDTR
ncbi:hypothetical protein BBJ28_00009954 [Nothophytophthora sp. Chile5]|nr:hypothetical protein BBJ28_00009954 [Nothophytophthora sp. Chile5]